jgi:hypothetical protein
MPVMPLADLTATLGARLIRREGTVQMRNDLSKYVSEVKLNGPE